MTKNNNVHSAAQMQLWCLLAAGALVVLSVFGELIPRTLPIYLVNYCLLIPCTLFLGVTWTAEVSELGRKRLTFGIGAGLWMILIQLAHLVFFREADNFQLYVGPCLIALPFASVYRKGDSQKGLAWIGAMYVGAALLLAGCALLLKFGTVPQRVTRMIYWDGVRLHVLWHPNITACLLMIAIAVCMGYLFDGKALWLRCGSGAAVVLFYYCMALTNGRTTLLLTSAMIAGTIFFRVIRRGGWKRVVIGLAIGLVLAPGLYMGATAIYDCHEASMQAAFRAEQAQTAEAPASGQEAAPAPEEETVPTSETAAQNTGAGPTSGDRSLERDLGTLNGRIKFWTAAGKALMAEPGIWLRGVYDSGETFTAYGTFQNPDHTHNSWLEILFQQGLVGLIFALAMTAAALIGGLRILLSRETTISQKSMAMLICALLGSGFLEPVLFTNSQYYHFINFFFCLGLGYVDLWSHMLPAREKK